MARDECPTSGNSGIQVMESKTWGRENPIS
jgi:hypothetical protein